MSRMEKKLADYSAEDENFDERPEADEESQEMARLYEESFKSVEEGSVVRGRVIQVRQDGIVVDVGYKSEGIIPIEEVSQEELKNVKVGDEIEVYLEEREDS